jgi:signal transduction histidine kinase
MPRLFWKLFGAFWLTTFVILTVTVFVSFRIAHEQSEESFVDPREIDAELQTVLHTAGIEGLRKFVRNPENFSPGQTVYLVDEYGKDLLDRQLPERVQSRARRIWSSINERSRERRNTERRPWHLRQSLLATADGKLLLAMPGPAPPLRFGFFSSGSGRWTVLTLAAAISLLSFWLLSRSLTRPVAKITEAATQLAAGDMAARVGAGVYSSDEIGRLAVQFDRMAEDLDAQSTMRREMFRNIAHELRAPLTRLQIATELLERKPERPTENLERIRYEIERVETLASQVLSLAHAEQDLDPNDVTSLSEVAQQIARDAEFEADARNVQLRFDAPAEDLRVRGNPDAIASAIENVVRNAVQHTPRDGEVSLTVKAGSPCIVTVTDTGPGVADEAVDRIFEPFYRIDTNLPGAGIGLAIARRVLHQVGGEIKAMNRAGGGFEVTMRFPRSVNR